MAKTKKTNARPTKPTGKTVFHKLPRLHRKADKDGCIHSGRTGEIELGNAGKNTRALKELAAKNEQAAAELQREQAEKDEYNARMKKRFGVECVANAFTKPVDGVPKFKPKSSGRK